MPGELFTNYFLEEGILHTDAWQESLSQPPDFDSFRTQALALLENASNFHTINEASTEQELIRPLFQLLGWVDYLPQQGSDRNEDIPDHLLFGAAIEGWGQTVGARLDANTRTSALKFGSDERRSLIRAGSGYWKYEQIEDEVRFITGYDYEVRWGPLGWAFDRLLFRPLIGWATACSFDRLRLWIEQGRDPRQAARQALSHALAAAAIAFIWIWQGVVPKLLTLHPDELALVLASGLPETWAAAVRLLGAAELAFGTVFLLYARRRWPWLLTIALMALALVGLLVAAPQQVAGPFSPIALNLLMAVLAAIGLLSLPDLPSARNCLRRPPREAAKETGL